MSLPNTPPKKLLRVVIVEDHPQLCDLLKRMIQSEDGLECCGEFMNGEDAIKSIAKICPDVVTLDLSLPDINGISLFNEIKRVSPKTQCIFFSGHTDEMFVEQGLAAGARGYLFKEDVAQLTHCIRKVAAGEICVSERFEIVLARFRNVS